MASRGAADGASNGWEPTGRTVVLVALPLLCFLVALMVFRPAYYPLLALAPALAFNFVVNRYMRSRGLAPEDRPPRAIRSRVLAVIVIAAWLAAVAWAISRSGPHYVAYVTAITIIGLCGIAALWQLRSAYFRSK